MISILLLSSSLALAQQQPPPDADDFRAALLEANQEIAGLTNRAESLSIELSRAQRNIAQLKQELQGKTPVPPQDKK